MATITVKVWIDERQAHGRYAVGQSTVPAYIPVHRRPAEPRQAGVLVVGIGAWRRGHFRLFLRLGFLLLLFFFVVFFLVLLVPSPCIEPDGPSGPFAAPLASDGAFSA